MKQRKSTSITYIASEHTIPRRRLPILTESDDAVVDVDASPGVPMDYARMVHALQCLVALVSPADTLGTFNLTQEEAQMKHVITGNVRVVVLRCVSALLAASNSLIPTPDLTN